jgi:hypothetical protein
VVIIYKRREKKKRKKNKKIKKKAEIYNKMFVARVFFVYVCIPLFFNLVPGKGRGGGGGV